MSRQCPLEWAFSSCYFVLARVSGGLAGTGALVLSAVAGAVTDTLCFGAVAGLSTCELFFGFGRVTGCVMIIFLNL